MFGKPDYPPPLSDGYGVIQDQDPSLIFMEREHWVTPKHSLNNTELHQDI